MEKRPILKKERLSKGEEHVRWLFHPHITRVHGNSDSMCLLILLKSEISNHIYIESKAKENKSYVLKARRERRKGTTNSLVREHNIKIPKKVFN